MLAINYQPKVQCILLQIGTGLGVLCTSDDGHVTLEPVNPSVYIVNVCRS